MGCIGLFLFQGEHRCHSNPKGHDTDKILKLQNFLYLNIVIINNVHCLLLFRKSLAMSVSNLHSFIRHVSPLPSKGRIGSFTL